MNCVSKMDITLRQLMCYLLQFVRFILYLYDYYTDRAENSENPVQVENPSLSPLESLKGPMARLDGAAQFRVKGA